MADMLLCSPTSSFRRPIVFGLFQFGYDRSVGGFRKSAHLHDDERQVHESTRTLGTVASATADKRSTGQNHHPSFFTEADNAYCQASLYHSFSAKKQSAGEDVKLLERELNQSGHSASNFCSKKTPFHSKLTPKSPSTHCLCLVLCLARIAASKGGVRGVDMDRHFSWKVPTQTISVR